MNKILQSLIFIIFVIYLGRSFFTKLPYRVNSQNIDKQTYQVKSGSVHDGDTFRVIDTNGQELKVRFACIDTREIGQVGGESDRDFLISLLQNHNNRVKLEVMGQDRFNRTIAVVWAGDVLVPLAQVEAGQAFAYDRYKDDCPYFDQIKQAEAIARSQKLGVWAVENPEYPWEWRRRNK